VIIETCSDWVEDPPQPFAVMGRLFLCLCALGSFGLLLGCATTNEIYKVSAAPAPSNFTFAVRQFTADKEQQLSVGDRGVRDFEKIYLPAEIVAALGRHPGVKAYYATQDTPATDFVLSGKVLASDGKKLAVLLEMFRVDGKRVAVERFQIENRDARPRVIDEKMSSYFSQMAGWAVSKARTTTDISLPEARAKAYASNRTLVVTPKELKNSELAGDIERTELLQPLSTLVIPRVKIAAKLYREWQVLTIPLQRDRELAKTEQGIGIANVGIGVVYAGASVASGVASASQGNQAGLQASGLGVTRGLAMATDGSADAEIAANRIKAIERTMAAYKNEFAVGAPRQVTVRIYDKILTFTGDQSEMLRDFREVVRNELN